MSKMNLSETSILTNYSNEFETTVGPEVEPLEVLSIYRSLFSAVSDFFRETKKKNQKVALLFNDVANNFIMASVIEYNNNEEEGQDNWNYFFTFDQEDIKDVPESNKHTTNESYFHAALNNRLREFGLRCNEASFVEPMISLAARTLSSFLEQNASINEEVELVDEGYFIATSSVEENNEIVKTLLPDSEMKVLIKDDTMTEK